LWMKLRNLNRYKGHPNLVNFLLNRLAFYKRQLKSANKHLNEMIIKRETLIRVCLKLKDEEDEEDIDHWGVAPLVDAHIANLLTGKKRPRSEEFRMEEEPKAKRCRHLRVVAPILE